MSKFKEFQLKHQTGSFNVVAPDLRNGFSEDTYFCEWRTGRPLRISEITAEHYLVGCSVDSRVSPVQLSVLVQGGRVRMHRYLFLDHKAMAFGELHGAEIHCTTGCSIMVQDEDTVRPDHTVAVDTEFGQLSDPEKTPTWAACYTRKYKQEEFPLARTVFQFCQVSELSHRTCWSFDIKPVSGAPVDFVLLSNGLFVSCFI